MDYEKLYKEAILMMISWVKEDTRDLNNKYSSYIEMKKHNDKAFDEFISHISEKDPESNNSLYTYEDLEKPVEWNEDDEDSRDIAIRIIQNGGDDCAGILDSEKALNWLKSIKPQQNQYDKGYHDGYSAAKYLQWKPSEEQMEALYKAKNNPANYYDIKLVLQSLYNDLKNL